MKVFRTIKPKGFNPNFFWLFLILMTASLTFAQGKNVKPIRLSTGNYTPVKITIQDKTTPSKSTSAETTAISQTHKFDGKYFKLIQFDKLPTDAERKAWEANGLHLVDFLHVDTYFAVIDQKFDLSPLASNVLTIIDVDPTLKMEAELIAKRANGESPDKLVVSYFAFIDGQQVIHDLRSRGVTIEKHREFSRQIDIIINSDQFDDIVALPCLQFVGAQPGEPELEGEGYPNNASGRANYLNTGFMGLNFDGSGVTIAIGEGGTVDNHIDFRGRLTEMVAGSPSSHKTGSMRNAGSAGNQDPTDYTTATGATLLSTVGGTDYAGLHASDNLRFTNHSFGFGVGGGYNSAARNHDLRIATLPTHIVSYSAGNNGGATGYAPYNGFSGWANITGAAKHNKNHFAIGALTRVDVLTNFSSRGPAQDGRILPHVAIEGGGGTSFASPDIVGQMAILLQVYKSLNAGAEAPSNLLRAVMMNTADDLLNPGPDYKTGYGRPNMRRAYDVLNSTQYLTSSVSNGVTNTHNITVPAGTEQVRVMLMWPDVAASVNASPTLVNNLNLVLEDPSSTPFNPWVLDPTANVVNLDAFATRQVDTLNTMEQVTVDNPSSGTWTIEVNGALVPSGPQTYYIVYEFLEDELHIGFPLKDVRLEPSTDYQIKWDSYGGTGGTFDLDYRIDGGSWVSIVTGYDATSRNYTWTSPAVSPGIHTVEIRVMRGALTVQSDICYIGEVPENFEIDFACDDAVKLTWNDVGGATSYKMYRLGTKYMEEVTTNITFTGASAILTGMSTIVDEYFAVSALTGANEGLRTNALQKTVGDINCVNTKTTVASAVNKTNITLKGIVNPLGSTLNDVHFEYGPTTSYGSTTPNIAVTPTGFIKEAVSNTIASTLSSRTDTLHYRLVGKSDGSNVYGEDQEISLAPGKNFIFDGTGDLLILEEPTVFGPTFSFVAWIKFPTGSSGARTIASWNKLVTNRVGFLRVDGSSRLQYGQWNGSVFHSVLDATALSPDLWYHVAIVKNSGAVTLYIDGQAVETGTANNDASIVDEAFALGAEYGGSNAIGFFSGNIDEASLWSKALSVSEIRDLMHQPLQANETDLNNYLMMDGIWNTAWDVVTQEKLQFMGDVQKVNSTVPFGVGTEFTATEAAGTVTFTGTGLEANYSSQNGATVIVSKIEIEANATTGIPGTIAILDEQYWVVHRHGTGSFSADVTFTVSEDLTAPEAATPANISLYQRVKGEDGTWTLLATANSVDDTNEKATFNGITVFDRQFMLTREGDPIADAGSDQSICLNDSVQIGGSPTATGGTAPYAFSWTPTTGLSDATAANPKASPADTTTYIVTVTDDNGNTDMDTMVVIIQPLAQADAGPDQSICLNDSVQIGGSPTAAGGTAPFTFSWTPTAGLSDATIANPKASPADTTEYIVTITDGNSKTDMDTMTVIVQPLVQADAGSDQAICLGDSVQIGGSPTAAGGTAPFTFSWTPTAGLSDETIANPKASPADTTEYIVTITDANSKTDMDTIIVIVNPDLVADAGSNQSIAPGGSVQIGGTPTASGGTGGYTYSWDPTTGLDDETIANPTASPASNTTYTVIITDANSCKDTSDVLVSVTAGLVVNAGADKVICPGDSVQIGGSPTAMSGAAPYTYSWTPTTGLDDATVANPKASPADTTIYTVEVTDNNSQTAQDEVTVAVNPNLVADAGSNQSIAPGGSVQIGGTPTASGGTGGYTYSWDPTTGLDDETIANPTASPASNTTYTVIITDANSCKDTSDVLVSVTAGLVVNAGADKVICPGDSVQIGGSPTAMSGAAPYTYSWTPTTGLDDATVANPKASPADTTIYTVEVTDNNSQTAQDEVTVAVNPNLVADAGSNQSIAPGGSVQIGGTPTASGGTGGYTYSWTPIASLDNAALSNPIASPASNTTYTVIITDANNCKDTSDVLVTVTAGLAANAGADQVICPGDSIQIGGSPTAMSGAAPYTYSWMPTTGLDDATVANPKASPADTTIYTVEVTDNNSQTAQDEVTVAVNPNLVADAGSNQNIAPGGSVQIGGTPTANGGTGGYTYSWTPIASLDNAALSNPIASPASNTTYTVIITDANNCKDTSDVLVTVGVSVVKAKTLLAEILIKGIKNSSVDGDIFSNNDINLGKGRPTTYDGDVTAVGDINVARKNNIAGDVIASGTANVDGSATVGGTIQSGATISVCPLPTLSFSCTGVNGSITVGKSDEQDILPGSFTTISVKKKGVLGLSAGEYFVNSFKLDKSARLEIDAAGGSVIVNVCQDLSFQKNVAIEITGGTTKDFTINYMGTKKVSLGKDGIFKGDLVAPLAIVRLESGAVFQGTICAKQIDLRKDSRVAHHDSTIILVKHLADAESDNDERIGSTVVTDYALDQNHPNPFNPTTKINFALPQAGTVKVQIYDLLGKNVRTLVNKHKVAGRHEVSWNGRNRAGNIVAAGTYIYRMTVQQADGEAQIVLTKKMLFLK